MQSPNKPHIPLMGSTEDPGAASTSAVSRPKAGGPPLLWYRDTKPRFYRPYMIRVLRRDDTKMEFVFLHAKSGEDLALSQRSFEISYHDGRYAYSALPSTVQKVQAGSEHSCGLLFISDLFMQSISRADRDKILEAGNAIGKYPWAEGKFAELIERLESKLGGRLSEEDQADVASMLELLKSVA